MFYSAYVSMCTLGIFAFLNLQTQYVGQFMVNHMQRKSYFVLIVWMRVTECECAAQAGLICWHVCLQAVVLLAMEKFSHCIPQQLCKGKNWVQRSLHAEY